MGDSVRLPDGRLTTFARARSRGWIDADGNFTALAPKPRVEQVAIERANRQRDWRRKQGLPPIEEDEGAQAALLGKAAPKIKPLKPRNVDKTGAEITDKALLDEIEAKTRLIEQENNRE